MKVLKDLAVSGQITVGQLLQSSIDTDKFIVSDGGVAKFRTGSQLLGDIDGVINTRTITINGTAQDLTANRSWTVGDVRTDSSYANPAWITSLAWSKITGAPAFLTAEADTLATVTGRGASTSTTLSLAKVITTGLYGPGGTGNIAIWQYDSANTGYGLVYVEGTPSDALRIDVSGNALTGTPDFQISPDAAYINGALVATQSWVTSQGYITSVSDVWVNNSGDSMTGNLSFGSSGAGITWAANTDGASITFESTGDGASGGRALSNLLIALSDNGDEGLKVTSAGTELFYVNTNQIQYKGNTVWHSANDGAGSGLDADLLDGISSASFLRSDVVGASLTGTIVSSNNANVDGPNFEVNTTNKTVNEYAYKVSRSGSAVGGILIDGRGSFASGTTVNGSTVWHQGNLTNLNQLTNGPGYLTAESDTLATVTNRGNTTTGRINVRGAGNQSGGNILMGNTGNATNKWSYLTGAHYNADSQPQGFALIGGLSTDTYNAVVIGGNIYETNPATEIQFWTHNATTHNLGGTQRGVINSSGNWGIGTNTPQVKLDINGHVGIVGSNYLYFGHTTTNIGAWTTRQYSSGSTHYFNAQTFIFNNEGYGSIDILRADTNGVGIRRAASSNQRLAIDAADSIWVLDAYRSGIEIGGIHVNNGILTLQGSSGNEVRLATTGNATWNGDILATRPWVQAQGYITSSGSITGDAGSVGGVSAARIVFGESGRRKGTWLITDWNQNTYPDVAFLSAEPNATNAPNSDYLYGMQYSFHRSGAAYRTQFVTSLYSDLTIYVRNSRDSDAWTSWKTLWHSGNLTNLSQLTNGPGYVTGGPYLPTAGGTMTGSITVNSIDQSLIAQSNGNGSTWYGRILSKNSTNDRASFLGTYGSVAGVFAHNNALNAWADLYVNTVDGSGGGTVRMPSSVLVNGNQVWHAGNDGSGSGLDADLLDGQDQSYYFSKANMDAARNIVSGTNLDTDLENGGAYSSYGAGGTSWNAPFPYGGVIAYAFTSGIRAQFGFDIRHTSSDYGNLWYRTKNNVGYSTWRTIWHSGNLTNLNQLTNGPGYITQSTGDGRYLLGTTSPSTPGNFTLSIGNNGSYSYVQSHSSQPLELNPVGNTVRIAGNVVWHQGNLTNLNQLTNGPGYITSSSLSSYLPLSGGTMSGNLYIQSGGNPTQFNLRGTNPELYVDATYGGGTARIFINRQSNANQATLLFTTGATVTNGTAWNFTGAPVWSMGMTNSSQVSDFKLAYGDIYDAPSVALRIDTSKNVYLSRLHVEDASSGVSMHVGVGSTHGVYTLDNARRYLVVSGDYYPHMAIVARYANNTNHGAVFSFVGSEGGAFRQWNLGISNSNPFLFSIGYNRTTDPNPHYGVGDGWSGDDNNHARLSIDRDGNTKIRGMLYVNGTSGSISTGSPVLHSGNFTTWAQPKVYQGQSDGNWQNFTNDVGEFRVDEVLNITSGNHSNHPTGVYTYGGVMSWRLNNHSFQLYAAHTGDLAYKTQWGNDNYSGWRRILDSSSYPYAASMNQYVNTGSDPTFNSVYLANGNLRLYQGDGTALRIVTAYGYINIGPQNGSWAHIYSNLNFYFNQNLYVNGTQVVTNSGTWSININGSAGSATYADRLQTGNNQWTWSTGAHTATNPNTITLWDQYANYGGSGNPTGYGTILDIYGRSGHEHDQLYFGESGQFLHRNCFYGTNSWSGWRTIITSDNIGSQTVNRADGALKLWATSHPNNYYIVNNWTGSYWQLTSNHGAGVQVAYADSAGSASSASYASSAGSVAWSNVSSKPANWLNTTNLIDDYAPQGTAVPSGFYQNYAGSGNPTGTWFNYINVRHSNPANGHGFQIGMSYYDTNLWFRSYQGGTSPTFSSWATALSTLNYTSYVIPIGGGWYGANLPGSRWYGYTVNGGEFVLGNGLPNAGQVGVLIDGCYVAGENNGFWSLPGSNDWNARRGMYWDGSYLNFTTNTPTARFQAVYADGDITAFSDARVKENIRSIDNALQKVLASKGIVYDRIDTGEKDNIGFIAQELEEQIPNLVKTDAEGFKSVKYQNMVAILTEAIKEQQKQIEELKEQLKNR